MDPSDDLLDERKQRKLAHMLRRDDERKVDLQNKQDERKIGTSTTIGRKYFDDEYPRMKAHVDELFQQLTNHSSTSDQSIQELADEMQQLEKFLTAHADILRSRDLANAQSTIGFLSY
jgi:hypothetical protein